MFWRLLLFSLAVGGYVYLRALHPLRWRRVCKIPAAVALVAVALRLPLLALTEGDTPHAPGVPAWLNVVYSWLFISLLMWFCGIFAAHVLRSVALERFAAWRRKAAAEQQRIYNRLHLMMLLGALAVSALGTHEGLREARVREITIPCAVQKPLRIALLTDLHVSKLKRPDYLHRLVERTNELGADMVCIAGDFVDGSVEQCGGRMLALGELRAPLGVYGVAGNHDYYSGYEEWRRFFTEHGVHMLDNAHTLLPGGAATLAGVTEQTAELIPGMEPPNLRAALHGAPEGAPVILLSHRPGLLAEAAELGVAVQLSGHTHGGLVWGVGLLVAAMNDGYLSGLYREGHTQLYVSPGTNTGSRTPFRLGVPSEITLITLTPTLPAP